MKVQARVFLLGAVGALTVMLLMVFGTEVAQAQPPGCLQVLTCNGFPDGQEDSGRFINVTRGLSSLGDTDPTQSVFNVSLKSPGTGEGTGPFELAVFDGDLSGKWDRWIPGAFVDSLIFRLYKDPMLSGSTADGDLLYEWPSTAMPDNDWCVLNPDYDINTSPDGDVCAAPLTRLPQAVGAWNAADQVHYYHLVVNWVLPGGDPNALGTDEQNNFKVALEGEAFLRGGSTIGFEGFRVDTPNPMTFTEYDGTFGFKFLVPDGTTEMLFFDGDADEKVDNDDANSPNDVQVFPPFQTSPDTIDEGVNHGNPPDDSNFDIFKYPGEPSYTISTPSDAAPADSWSRTNSEVSGDKEWELYKLGLDSSGCAIPTDCDATVPSIPGGLYSWTFDALDAQNTMFVHTIYPLFAQLASLGNTVWNDLNGDGFWDQGAESGIANVRVNLYREGGDGVCNPGIGGSDETFLSFEETDGGGQYLFDDLMTGVYCVEVDSGNFDVGGPLAGLVQTVDWSSEAGDHYNRANPWLVEIPINIYYRFADFGYYEEVDPPGGQGCTPGYWKQRHHFGNWVGYTPSDSFDDKFDVVAQFDTDPTLLEALKAKGGGESALARHAVAALLNSAQDNVDYLFTADEIIGLVQGAYESGDFEPLKNTFDAENNQGCPLGRADNGNRGNRGIRGSSLSGEEFSSYTYLPLLP